MRSSKKFQLKNPSEFRRKLLKWGDRSHEVTWLDSNDYPQKTSNFDAVLAVDAFTLLKTDAHNAFEKLREYQEITNDWLFGYLSYDLKNDVEDLKSSNFDGLHFPELYFFQPQKLIFLKGDTAEFLYLRMIEEEMETDFNEIRNSSVEKSDKNSEKAEIRSRLSKQEYLNKVEEILQHIHRGDIYEANFCQEFYAENTNIEPLEVFADLNQISSSPFATYLKFDEFSLMSASPERYLQKKGTKISSEPIKGTARRSEDPERDKIIAEDLAKDPKENSENIMIVDLVRNDISKIAKKGSVQVEELCKVYSFKQVHQLISTISAELSFAFSPVGALQATFPMGSMTGAPKISAMKIIEELEETKRGLYSGAVGYFTPDGDFDFNVVIRSILYNSSKKYVSFSVGGAITSRSNPQNEYEECLLKAKAMRKVLS